MNEPNFDVSSKVERIVCEIRLFAEHRFITVSYLIDGLVTTGTNSVLTLTTGMKNQLV